jgi:polysaccharide deacetylase family protein (PEP-CTERM system associated)
MSETKSQLNPDKNARRNIVTVLLHDYFHRHVFNRTIGEKQWNRFESRRDKNIDDNCKLFDLFNIKATFFTLGWIAEKRPEIIKKLTSKGHEIASAGYEIGSVGEMSPKQFRDDIRRAKKALENAGASKIIGYRCAYGWLKKSDLWALDILTEEGYLYNASLRPQNHHGTTIYKHNRKRKWDEIYLITVLYPPCLLEETCLL